MCNDIIILLNFKQYNLKIIPIKGTQKINQLYSVEKVTQVKLSHFIFYLD